MKLVVIGYPIQHSLSPEIFKIFSEITNVPLSYIKHAVLEKDFPAFLNDFFKNGGIGCNITLPYKKYAAQFADICSDVVCSSGATNTLHFQNNKIYAYNTDGEGIINDFAKKNITLTNKNILIIGAGGAAAGIIPHILQEKPANLAICNRTLDKAQMLAHYFNVHAVLQASLCCDYDIIINATSLSLSNQVPQIDGKILKNTICYDLCYKLGAQTIFEEWALQNDASCAFNGLGMLIEQAAIGFKIWTSVSVSTDVAMQRLMSKRQNHL